MIFLIAIMLRKIYKILHKKHNTIIKYKLLDKDEIINIR